MVFLAIAVTLFYYSYRNRERVDRQLNGSVPNWKLSANIGSNEESLYFLDTKAQYISFGPKGLSLSNFHYTGDFTL